MHQKPYLLYHKCLNVSRAPLYFVAKRTNFTSILDQKNWRLKYGLKCYHGYLLKSRIALCILNIGYVLHLPELAAASARFWRRASQAGSWRIQGRPERRSLGACPAEGSAGVKHASLQQLRKESGESKQAYYDEPGKGDPHPPVFAVGRDGPRFRGAGPGSG